MIIVFGSVNIDLVARVEAIARPGETVLSPRYDRFFGGKGANQAVAAARAQKTGALPIRLCAAIGSDGFGEECLANFAREGIDTTPVQKVDSGTGCAFITVDRRGENAITVASGANARLEAAALAERATAGATVVVLQMEVPWRESASVAARFASNGAHVVLNLAPAPRDMSEAELRELHENVHTLVVNQGERDTLADRLGCAGPDAAARIASALGLTVVVTLGGDGVLLAEPGEPEWRSPARAVEVVDTTGAGDTFVGVLAVGLAERLPHREAIRRAGFAATLSTLKHGAQSGMPRRDEIDRFAAEVS